LIRARTSKMLSAIIAYPKVIFIIIIVRNKKSMLYSELID
jgi:hypothetical protein